MTQNTTDNEPGEALPERVWIDTVDGRRRGHGAYDKPSQFGKSIEYVRADLASRASVAAVEGDAVRDLVATWRARAKAMEPEVNRTWDDDGALKMRTIRQLADELAAVLSNAAASSPAEPAQPEGEQEKRDQQREADAKIADSFRYGWNSENTFCQVAETIAAAIRAEKGK